MKVLPNRIQQQLEQAIKDQDWQTFLKIRYSYGQEGSVFLIENIDLQYAQLGHIPSDLLCFKNCNLENASFQGKQFWPTSLWDCSARNLDLRHTHGMLFALNTDLRGAKFDQSTELFPSWHTVTPSSFKNCQLDESFLAFLIEQGCRLDITDIDFKNSFTDTWDEYPADD